MELNKSQFMPFPEAMKSLYRLCVQRRSGVMYYFTDTGEGAVFSFALGHIVDIIYGAERGVKALDMLQDDAAQRINCKFIFRFDPSFRKKVRDVNDKLPPDNVILNKLGVDVDPTHFWLADSVKKILIVDDSRLSRRVIRNIFEGKSYDIAEAEDGLEAMSRLNHRKPDIVILDLILPKMDGYQVLDAMKKRDDYQNIPVIMLTSRDALMDKLKGKMSATDEYLTKPVKPEELIAKVEKYLG